MLALGLAAVPFVKGVTDKSNEMSPDRFSVKSQSVIYVYPKYSNEIFACGNGKSICRDFTPPLTSGCKKEIK